ncbi:protein of unknown function [Friedmanniella luteola]|uniref:DUF1707 domain-containing protein n=1 Tax=Friedmanniella luteola TaxID=546871 RepID=A0A1H1YYV7_9ACTN|nr:DUF1707 domain-containing protein [Friedmanniella luteola]SDT26603.1 protein of unknown function [Friedmanniella luteola]
MSSDLPISSPYRSTPALPVDDGERDRLSTRLNAAFEAGTLAPQDYQARLDRLFAAQTLGELVPVVQGLPPLATYTDPAAVASAGGRPGELAPARSGNGLTVVAVAGIAGAVLLVVLLLLVLL